MSENAVLGAPSTLNSGGGRVLVPALMALMGGLLFAYSYAGAPALPIADGWVWIAHAEARAEGGVAALVRSKGPLLHGQHLYLLPSLIALMVGPLVDYSFRPFAVFSACLLIACSVTFYRLARRCGLGRFEALVVFLTAASFRHYENLLLGFQFGLVLCVLLGSWAIIVADTRRDVRGFAAALVLSCGSALSSSAGILACVVICVVRWLNPARRRDWIAIGIALAAVPLVMHLALSSLGLLRSSFVPYLMQQLSWSALPVIFTDWVELIGGGLGARDTAAPLGLALLAGTSALLVTRVRRVKRIDALSGLSVFALLCTATIAVARAPITDPASRHAIFATPLVCVCGIELFPIVRTWTPGARAAAISAILVGWAWLCTDAVWNAGASRRQVDKSELELRTYLARLASGGTLSDDELAHVFPGPPRFVEGMMRHVVEHRLAVFAEGDHGFEVHDELPERARGAVRGTVEAGSMRFEAPGSFFASYPCAYPSGCLASFFVDIAAEHDATIGVVVRRADGSERADVSVRVPAGEACARHVVRARAEPGDTLEPYVSSAAPSNAVRVETSSFVMIEVSPIP